MRTNGDRVVSDARGSRSGALAPHHLPPFFSGILAPLNIARPAAVACLLFISAVFPACTKAKSGAPKADAEAALTTAQPADGAPGTRWKPERELGKGLRDLRFAEKSADRNLSDTCVLELASERFLVVVSDEGHEFGVVRLGAPERGKLYDLAELSSPGVDVSLPGAGTKVEIDFEAVASERERVLLVGSASLKRKQPKGDSADSSKLAEVVPASGPGRHFSDFVYELRAEKHGGDFPEFTLVGARDLREILLGLPLLSSFREIPSKDNGIDIEGAVAHGGFYYFGLRGPVLRGRALIARTRSDFSEPELFAFDLGGLGVRALTVVATPPAARGVYILAGPTMPTKTDFSLYRWADFDRAQKEDGAKVTLVGSVPSKGDLHPEALFALDGSICTVSDGDPGGGPACRPLP